MKPTVDYLSMSLYSEWLDSQGLMADPKEGDKRTHEDLVHEFIAEYEGHSE